MEATQIKKVFEAIKFHVKIAWRGLLRTLHGAVIAAVAAMSVYGFVTLNAETGWAAVSDFVASCATLAVALANVYLIGARKKVSKRG